MRKKTLKHTRQCNMKTKDESNSFTAPASDTELASVTPINRPPLGYRMAARPIEGMEWNPLLSLPRNRQCPCLSGRKFKACCLPNLPRVVAAELAASIREQMRKPDLVFLTPDNEAKILQMQNEKGITT